jgi:hypothetical protein
MLCSARALFVGLGHGAPVGGNEREPAPFRRRDLDAFGMLAEHGRALLGLDVLVDHGNERPGADDLILVGRAGGRTEHRENTEQKRAHGSSV